MTIGNEPLVLGRFDMHDQKLTVSRMQCVVEVGADDVEAAQLEHALLLRREEGRVLLLGLLDGLRKAYSGNAAPWHEGGKEAMDLIPDEVKKFYVQDFTAHTELAPDFHADVGRRGARWA